MIYSRRDVVTILLALCLIGFASRADAAETTVLKRQDGGVAFVSGLLIEKTIGCGPAVPMQCILAGSLKLSAVEGKQIVVIVDLAARKDNVDVIGQAKVGDLITASGSYYESIENGSPLSEVMVRSAPSSFVRITHSPNNQEQK